VGSYNDHDDLVFTVTDSATSIPATPSPSNKPTLAVSSCFDVSNMMLIKPI